MSLSSFLQAEVIATCNALGYSEGSKYFKEPDCLETLKDLIRFLKHDDDVHEVRRQLGYTKVLQTDLLPLLKNYYGEKELFDILLRLLVNLTNSALLLFNEELPEDKVTRNYYLEIVSHLQEYKQAFADDKIFAILTEKLGTLLQLDWEHRQEEDGLVIERILILVRNVLHIPADPQEEKRTDNDASVHDQVLWALHQSGMEDLLLYIASSENETNLCMHVLEIISLMFREQNPQQLASAGLTRSKTEKEKDEQELLAMRNREVAQRKANLRKYNSTRHSRFGGTFSVQNVKSISDKELIYHRPLVDAKSLNFDASKAPKIPPRHRRPMEANDLVRKSTLSIRLFLKEFCIEFLTNSYNLLMNIVKDNLEHQRTQAHDESYYLWAMKFFMEFNRLYEFKVELVSETMTVQSYHYIQTHIENYYEMIKMEKKKAPLWSRRLHLAVKAYQELLYTLSAMDQSSDSTIRESSRVIKGNLFYLLEYRELPIILIHNYDELKMPKSYLKDLVELNHIFLKLLEVFMKQNSHLVVQNKKKKAARRKKQQAKAAAAQPSELTENQLEELWDKTGLELSPYLQGEIAVPQDVVPFDPTSEISVDDQKANAMQNIQELLRKNQTGQAVALFRAAREVWPENNVFGAADISPEEELLALREVFFAKIAWPSRPAATSFNSPPETDVNVHQPLDEDDNDDEEAESSVRITEQEFNFEDFVKRFASPRVVQPYCLLLRQYARNSAFTNHCIVKMLHRIAWDCKMYPLLFQASVFRIFQKLVQEPDWKSNSSLKELVKFASFILGKFFVVAQANPKIFVEILFWKSHQDAYEVEHGYGTYKKKTAGKVLWTEAEEFELEKLYNEYKDVNDEKDVVDHILDHLIDDTKTRRQVIKQLIRQQLIRNTHDIVKKYPTVRKRLPKEWEEHEEVELRSFFEQFKDTNDVLGRILDNLTVKRSKKQVVEKLLALGLVADRKELRKKRQSKKPDNKSRKSRSFSSDEDGGSSSEELSTDSSTSDESEEEEDAPSTVTADQLPALVKELMDKGWTSSIEWIRGILAEEAKDREEEDAEEATPFVPFTEQSQLAMANEDFQRFLLTIGLKAPSSEQESFWRIPTILSAGRLQDLAQFLSKTLTGESVVVPNIPVHVIQNKVKKDAKKKQKDKKKRLEKIVKRAKQRKETRDSRKKQKRTKDDTDNEEQGSGGPESSKKSKPKERKNRRSISAEDTEGGVSKRSRGNSESESSSDEEALARLRNMMKKTEESDETPSKMKKRLLPDSDDGAPRTKENSKKLRLDSAAKTPKTKSRIVKKKTEESDSTSDDEPLASLRTSVSHSVKEDISMDEEMVDLSTTLHYDSEGDLDVSQKRKSKKTVILSDSDSDDEDLQNKEEMMASGKEEDGEKSVTVKENTGDVEMETEEVSSENLQLRMDSEESEQQHQTVNQRKPVMSSETLPPHLQTLPLLDDDSDIDDNIPAKKPSNRVIQSDSDD